MKSMTKASRDRLVDLLVHGSLTASDSDDELFELGLLQDDGPRHVTLTDAGRDAARDELGDRLQDDGCDDCGTSMVELFWDEAYTWRLCRACYGAAKRGALSV